MIPENTNQITTTLNNGISMPLLGLGVYDMHGSEAEQAIRWALDIGYRLIDTAAMYGNEVQVGNAIRQSGLPRETIFITTKVNTTQHGYDKTLKAFDESLRKIDCDYIDLFMLHWPLRHTRYDTWRAIERLYTEGRVRAIGVANYLEPFLDEMAEYASIVPMVNQVEFSPFLYLSALLERCRHEGIVLQAYTPLVRGQRFNDPRLLAIADKYAKTPAQIILRWAIQLGVSTIPKSANYKRLKENFDVFDFTITEEDMQRLANFNENLRVVEDPMDCY